MMHSITISLFNRNIEKTINIVKTKLVRREIGIKIGGEIISMIGFADNIVIITESKKDSQRAINKMAETLKTFKMKINGKKYKDTDLRTENPKYYC